MMFWIQSIAGSVAGSLASGLMVAIWRFTNQVKENTKQTAKLSKLLHEHITNHP